MEEQEQSVCELEEARRELQELRQQVTQLPLTPPGLGRHTI